MMSNVEIVEIAVESGVMKVAALVELIIFMPSQNEHLTDRLEEVSEESGQDFKRKMFRVLVERADYELIEEMAKQEQFKRIGRKRYTIKARFGTVRVKRIRIKYKLNGITEIPAARAWHTPKQAMITQGLKNAICDIVSKQSYNNTVAELERETGEKKIISKTTVGNILKQEGARLAEAQSERATQTIIKEAAVAKQLLGRAESYIGEEYFEAIWLKGEQLNDKETAEEAYARVEWDNHEITNNIESSNCAISKANNGEGMPTPALVSVEIENEVERAKTIEATNKIDKELVMAQLDEVMVRAQPTEERRWLLQYNGVIASTAGKYYVTATTPTELIKQVSSVLTALGVGNNNKSLLVISDGARWIRQWFDSIGISNKQGLLCWYHLGVQCRRYIREAISNKEDRIIIRRALMKYLWQGQVDEARAYLAALTNEDNTSSKIESMPALERLRKYLLMRAAYIPNYLQRWRAGEWIASTQIERFNDWSIAIRCKKQGMKWTTRGIHALAALETARRNAELWNWRELGQLPSWRAVA